MIVTRASAAIALDYGQPLAPRMPAPPPRGTTGNPSLTLARAASSVGLPHAPSTRGTTATIAVTLARATHARDRNPSQMRARAADVRDDMPPNDHVRPRDPRAGQESNVRRRDRRAGHQSSSPVLGACHACPQDQ